MGNNELHDLHLLKQLPRVTTLFGINCDQLRDLSALEGSTLTSLQISVGHLTQEELAPIGSASELETLRLLYQEPCLRAHLPPAHAGVSVLDITSDVPVDLSSLRDWVSLRVLRLDLSVDQVDLTPLRAVTDLKVSVSGNVTVIGGDAFGDRLILSADAMSD
jgi:hypothetical protein